LLAFGEKHLLQKILSGTLLVPAFRNQPVSVNNPAVILKIVTKPAYDMDGYLYAGYFQHPVRGGSW
jgi:hypothetical protein